MIEYFIENYELAKKDKIVILGLSAGGVGAMIWGDWIQEKLKQQNSIAKVFVIGDGAMFPHSLVNAVTNETNLEKNWKFLINITNYEQNFT